MKKCLIKLLIIATFVILSDSLLKSQNLIDNPGFEDGMNHWWGFGSTEGTGSGTIVSSPVHSGTKALKIDYPDNQNWDFSPGSRISVEPGQIFDISCWAKTEAYSAGGQAQFCVIMYDSDYNTLFWNYSPCIFDAKQGDYKLYTSKFMVPSKVKYIQPDFNGWRSCTIYIDDVSLTLNPVSSLSGDYSIELKRSYIFLIFR
jgi:hypothetical protein